MIKSEFLYFFNDIPKYTRYQVLRPVVSALNTLLLSILRLYYDHYIYEYILACLLKAGIGKSADPALAWERLCKYMMALLREHLLLRNGR
jgi:hypothetical protein